MDDVAELTVLVHVTDRPDGGMRVLSDDVKGVFLGGSDRQRIWSIVGPSVAALLRSNHGLDVIRVSGPMTAPDGPGDVRLTVDYRVETRRTAA